MLKPIIVPPIIYIHIDNKTKKLVSCLLLLKSKISLFLHCKLYFEKYSYMI